ncbi:unnamed protein product [Caenorhabditis brenneri]
MSSFTLLSSYLFGIIDFYISSYNTFFSLNLNLPVNNLFQFSQLESLKCTLSGNDLEERKKIFDETVEDNETMSLNAVRKIHDSRTHPTEEDATTRKVEIWRR